MQIQAMNYHNTSFAKASVYERQLKFFARHFSSVGQQDLERYFDEKKWHKDKPGLIMAFYNGYRNNFDVMYPLLEKYGFTGWFFVASGFVDTPAGEQKAFGDAHTFNILSDEYTDGRYALSWNEIETLSEKHVVCSHTKTHSMVLRDGTAPECFEREIVQSAADINHHLTYPAPAFCWLGGDDYGSCPQAAEYIKRAGYIYMLGNYKIERVSRQEG